MTAILTTCRRPFQSVALTNPPTTTTTTTNDVTIRDDDDNTMSLACFLLHQMCGICVGDYQSRAIILDDYDNDVVVHANNSIVDNDYYNNEDDIIEYGLEIVDYDEILKTLTSYGRNHNTNSNDYEEEIRQLKHLQQKERGLLQYQSGEVPVEESKEDCCYDEDNNDKNNSITVRDDFNQENRKDHRNNPSQLSINENPSEESHTIPSTNNGAVTTTTTTKTEVLLEGNRVTTTPLRYNFPRLPPPKRQSSRVASE